MRIIVAMRLWRDKKLGFTLSRAWRTAGRLLNGPLTTKEL